ncbi:N-acetylglucosamine-6-phosphate deacetylase [Myxococcus sp. K15C18031901]|uniref:N-acetylglucosamine-6-phosphate deacetylase n=1 Tax=Myxococcus dinghuensis TaxID=2906761 RepID=UPI0020A7C807|nr:N-acetylglucosamine-6-phosphate deacetylase [Myxococcus dinghuensis]MCP3100212.1 N-acetylglucosamine-6-phosphate deacetylase [Myxococcus dinghuensis]
MTTQALLGARLFTGEQQLDGHALVLEDGRIADVVPESVLPAGVETRRLPENTLLAPGFIDLQVNGAGGVLFNETPTPDAALAIASTLRRFGTTALLPTFITDDPRRALQAQAAALEATARPEAGVLGLHLEGPFISPERAGVHDARFIRAPDDGAVESLVALAEQLDRLGGRLLVTLAPEHVADDVLQRLAAGGVVLSVGHTAASHERTLQAVKAGVRGFTHLFNAMPPITGRQPGPVLAGFEADEAWCGIIVDGHHVHPANLRLLLKTKPRGKVLLVSDAMPPVGTQATSFTLYGKHILRHDGRLMTENGTLAGADIDQATAVGNAVRLLDVSLDEALRMASLYPAHALGLEDSRGRLAPGLRADLALLAEDLTVLATWVGGNEQWH